MPPLPTSKGDILIVDDTPENLHLLSYMLEEQGYDVRSVTNGSTALMGLRAQAPDLVLLDINMPGMNGLEVCQRLKADPSTQAIPVIFISALNEIFDKVAAFQAGGVDYIVKPFQLEEVLVRIENQLQLCRLQNQLQHQNQQLQHTENNLRRALEQEKSLNQKIEEMAALEERNRIARDIHDALGHSLVALNIQLETAIALWDKSPSRSYAFLTEAKQLASETLQSVRHSVADLRTDPLNGKLLETAIASLVHEFSTTSGIHPDCAIALAAPISQHLNTVLYRVLQEGLTNILKHAAATAVQIKLESKTSGVVLHLCDNGKGFQVSDNLAGFGLRGMRERVTASSGHIDVRSSPGQGCQIYVSFPG
jgi:two-component system, sensor histidine kinase and response regulator